MGSRPIPTSKTSECCSLEKDLDFRKKDSPQGKILQRSLALAGEGRLRGV